MASISFSLHHLSHRLHFFTSKLRINYIILLLFFSLHSLASGNIEAFQPAVTTTTYTSPIKAAATAMTTPSKTLSMTTRSNMDIKDDIKKISIGFIGCGTIASAIATGLATQTTCPIGISSIAVTKRSESKSTRLSEMFPNLVTVFDDNTKSNQDLVDHSDIIFLCVLPQQVDDMLASLTFDVDRHILVSLVSTTTVTDLITKSGLPAEQVYKMICLPSVAFQKATCLVTPPITASKVKYVNQIPPSYLLPIFQSLGGYIECKTEDIMRAMMIPTSLMGPLYGILQNNRDWLVKQSVPSKDASYFLGKLYSSMIQDAERKCEDPSHFDDLIEEQTPGGLNEQSLKNLQKLGVYDAYNDAMDATLSRLEGISDGNII